MVEVIGMVPVQKFNVQNNSDFRKGQRKGCGILAILNIGILEQTYHNGVPEKQGTKTFPMDKELN